MNETADLSRALAFVFERIEREAARSVSLSATRNGFF